MTINYTTLLGLAKPVTGTESGAWGDIVNDQITSLLEDAVANAATINVGSGNVTLTDNNGSADQSRMAILLVTGSPGTSRNIVAPSISKWYIVRNGSDNAVVVKGSATTGVTIPTGSDALVFWNGSDFEIAAVAGPASSTDNAVVRYDGTTGKVVQNTGVTIDDSNNVAGVAQLTASGLEVSGNASVDVYKLRSNTATPTTTDAFVYRPADNTLALGTASTERMRIDSSGNVGIGTTAPANKMHVQVTNLVNSGVTSVLRLDHQASGSPSSGIGVGAEFAVETAAGNTEVGATIEAISTDVAPASEDFDLVFKTMSAGATAAERMRIDSLGNLGIGGITTPLSRLDALTAGGSCLGTFRNGTTTAQVGVTSSGGGQAYFGSTTNHLTRLIQNGTTQLQISTTGLVQMDNGYGSLQTFYGCRAWVNFDGTAVTIGSGRANGNVNSITDNGTGDYTINFTNAMPDANYAAIATCSQNDSAGRIAVVFNYLTTSVKVGTRDAAFALFDASIVNVAIFR